MACAPAWPGALLRIGHSPSYWESYGDFSNTRAATRFLRIVDSPSYREYYGDFSKIRAAMRAFADCR